MSRREDDLLLWGGVAALAGLALWKGPELAAAAVVGATNVTNLFARGDKLTETTPVNGVIVESPEDLVAAAAAVMGRPVDLKDYAVARMGRSEGVDGMAVRMHVAYNDLADLQRVYGTRVYSDVAALMLHSKVERADGHFSAQNLGKRYATTGDPYAGDLLLAEQVSREREIGLDRAAGGVKFVDKDGFGVQEGTGDYDDLIAEWTADGLEPVNVEGASSNLVVLRRA